MGVMTMKGWILKNKALEGGYDLMRNKMMTLLQLKVGYKFLHLIQTYSIMI